MNSLNGTIKNTVITVVVITVDLIKGRGKLKVGFKSFDLKK